MMEKVEESKFILSLLAPILKCFGLVFKVLGLLLILVWVFARPFFFFKYISFRIRVFFCILKPKKLITVRLTIYFASLNVFCFFPPQATETTSTVM